MPKSGRLRYKPVNNEITPDGTILCEVYVYDKRGDEKPVATQKAYLLSTKASVEQGLEKVGGRLGLVTMSRNADYNKISNKVKAALKAGKDPKGVAESDNF